MRAAQREAKLPPGYDGLCSTDEGRAQARALAGDRPHVVRFRMPDEGTTRVPDLLRDEVVFENVRLDDSVLLKSDGFPTYHLAVAVDDHEMEITHIIRSDEWLPSAPLHVRVFQALGYELPIMLHVPTVLGPDKAKLSKRHGAQAVLDYRDQGYLPEAIFNFLGLMGWSLDDKTEIISRDEFIEHFDLGRLLKSPAVFNIDKLNWMNGEYMRQMPVEQLAALIIEQLEKPQDEGGLPGSVPRPLDAAYTQQIIPLVRERVKLLPEARDMMAFFYMPAEIEYDIELLLGKAFREDRQRAALLLNEALVLAESDVAWEHEALEAAYRELATKHEVRAGDLFMLMRVAVTGRSVAPPLFETMVILGRERVVLRLRDAVGRL
jgi:glutamyl-tRNA synthetase